MKKKKKKEIHPTRRNKANSSHAEHVVLPVFFFYFLFFSIGIISFLFSRACIWSVMSELLQDRKGKERKGNVVRQNRVLMLQHLRGNGHTGKQHHEARQHDTTIVGFVPVVILVGRGVVLASLLLAAV